MTGIVITVFLINSFGLLNLLGISYQFFINQLFFLAVATLMFIVIRKTARIFLWRNQYFFYWSLLGLVLLTFFFGESVRGAKRWLHLLFFNFQASELLKIFYILSMTTVISDKIPNWLKKNQFIRMLGIYLLPTLIIFKQPDLGNAIIYTIIFLSYLLVAGFPGKYWLKLVIFLSIVSPIGWFLLKPYQQTRLITFINPQSDQQGAAYNMIQSIITIGSGKFFGRGLGLGTQSRLYFLPENYTDFAFASLIEQFGFFGGVIIFCLYFVLGLILVNKIFNYYFSSDSDSRKNFFYTLGLFTLFFSQMIINIGMNLGLLPVTGITLPFISYGGSSLVTLFLGLALLPN